MPWPLAHQPPVTAETSTSAQPKLETAFTGDCTQQLKPAERVHKTQNTCARSRGKQEKVTILQLVATLGWLLVCLWLIVFLRSPRHWLHFTPLLRLLLLPSFAAFRRAALVPSTLQHTTNPRELKSHLAACRWQRPIAVWEVFMPPLYASSPRGQFYCTLHCTKRASALSVFVYCSQVTHWPVAVSTGLRFVHFFTTTTTTTTSSSSSTTFSEVNRRVWCRSSKSVKLTNSRLWSLTEMRERT